MMKDNEDIKMTFGLTKKNLEIIESHLSKFEGAKYDYYTWGRIADDIGWERSGAILFYFEKISAEQCAQIAEQEKIAFAIELLNGLMNRFNGVYPEYHYEILVEEISELKSLQDATKTT